MAKRETAARRTLYSKALEGIVETEREKMADALAVLQCLNIAMDAQGVPPGGPFWPTIVDVALEKVKSAFNGLDLVSINARLTAKPNLRADAEAAD